MSQLESLLVFIRAPTFRQNDTDREGARGRVPEGLTLLDLIGASRHSASSRVLIFPCLARLRSAAGAFAALRSSRRRDALQHPRSFAKERMLWPSGRIRSPAPSVLPVMRTGLIPRPFT